MTVIELFISGLLMGFGLNILPKKKMLIVTLALIIVAVTIFAFLVDSGVNIFGGWTWTPLIFTLAGYWIGFGIAYCVKEWRDWN